MDQSHIDEELLLKLKNTKTSDSSKLKLLIQWVKQDSSIRGSSLAELMKRINLKMVPMSYRRFLIENEPIIREFHDCFKILTTSLLDSLKIIPSDIKSKAGIGVFDRVSKRLQVFNPIEKSWTAMQKMKEKDEGILYERFTAVVLDQHLYIFTIYHTVYRIVYSDPNASWERRTNKKLDYGPAVVLNGKIYTTDWEGDTNSMERYDPTSNRWTELPNKNEVVRHEALAVAEGQIFSIGGYSCARKFTRNVVEKFDPVTSSWTHDEPLSCSRAQATATSTLDGVIYVIGGILMSATDDVEFRCPRSKEWTTLCPLDIPLFRLNSCCIGGKIYAVQGYTMCRMFPEELTVEIYELCMLGKTENPRIEEYDPETDKWTGIASVEKMKIVDLASMVIPM